jgi:hypothetical protein
MLDSLHRNRKIGRYPFVTIAYLGRKIRTGIVDIAPRLC